LRQSLAERRDQTLGFQIILGEVDEHADPPHADGLLRAHRGWPGHRATEKCEGVKKSRRRTPLSWSKT